MQNDIQNDGQLQYVEPSALESMERAQTDVQITTAKRYPRPDLSIVKKKMLSLATLDQETAESCFYTLNRQGKVIQGPSARLAEIAVSSFGNIKAAARTIANDGKSITAQAVCHDLENNVCVAVEVKRRITGKDGRTFSEDMQIVTGNAAASIALRNAVFKVIPMALIKPIYEQAKSAAIGDIKTLAERRGRAVETFIKMGVKKEAILATLGKASEDDIDLKDLEILIGLHTAIKDGDTSIDEAFQKAEAVKPVFGKAKTEAESPVVVAVPEAVAVQSVEKTGIVLSEFEKVQILCEENGVDWQGVLPALKKLGVMPAKSNTVTSLRDCTEEKLGWTVENFDKVLPLLAAKAVAS